MRNGLSRITSWSRKIFSRTRKLLYMLEWGVCPNGFETKRICWRWIRTPTNFVFLDALLFIEERIVNSTQDKLVSSLQAFSTIIEFEGLGSTKVIFL